MIKAVIIDDEEDGRESLRLAITRFCPEVKIAALCSSADEGIAAINAFKPILVFLDIQMPKKSGFNMLEELGEFDFEVIFVTAFDNYAIKAIKFSALDYLLKPLDVDDLQKAVQKAVERINQKNHRSNYQSLLNNTKNTSRQIERLAIPDMEGIVFERIEDIIFCEADGNYTIIHLKGKRKIIVSKNLKDFEMILSDIEFFRIHHTYLVNMKQIKKYVRGEGGYVILAEDYQLDVSRRKKESFLQALRRFGIL